MSLWEFLACLEGWKAAHGGETRNDAAPMSIEAMRAAGIEGV